MPDTLFNEVPVVGTTYSKGDWKAYAIHTDTLIKGFFGPYRWLSNFWPAPIWFEGAIYPAVENAYQAAKILPEHRFTLCECQPHEAKRLWKSLPRMDASEFEWNTRRFDIMSGLVFQKFLLHKNLRHSLLETDTAYLEESNHWNDVYWGFDVNRKVGENYLGKILMRVRDYHEL